MKRIVLATLATLTVIGGAAHANPGNGHGGNGHPGRGWGVGEVPPGHQKKMRGDYRAGDRLPDGYTLIRDYERFGLPYPGDRYRYARYDSEVFKVARDTATVVEAIGIVSDLLN